MGEYDQIYMTTAFSEEKSCTSAQDVSDDSGQSVSGDEEESVSEMGKLIGVC